LEGPKKKLLVGLLTLAIVLIANVALWMVISSYEYKGIAMNEPWTPMPTATVAISPVTVDPQPSQTSTIQSSPTSTIDPAKNCTHNAAYWFSHQDVWPSKIIIANFSYSGEEVNAVYQAQSGEVPASMFIQLNAAFLNAVSGADYSTVYSTILDAANWLQLHPQGSEISQADQDAAVAFWERLLDFNEGRLGPGTCVNQITPSPEMPTTVPASLATITPTYANQPALPTTNVQEPKQPKPHNPPKKTNPPPQPTIQPTKEPPTSEPPPTKAPTKPPVPTQAPTRPPAPTQAPTKSS
jgi:hypothetical protein